MPTIPNRRRRPSPGPMIAASATAARGQAEDRAIPGEELWWPPGGSAGVVVTEQTALQLPALLATVVTLSTDTSVLPLRVMQEGEDGSTRMAKEHAAHELVARSPDGEATPLRWRQSLMSHALVYGNGYAEIQRRGSGSPYALHLLDPLSTVAKRRPDRSLYYQLGNGKDLLPQDVLHISGLGFDGISGYNMIRLLRQTVGLGIAEETFTADFFSNGSEAGGTIELPGRVKDNDAYQRLVNGWEGRHQGAGRRHRVTILEEGAKYNATSTDPDRAQLVEARKFQLLEVIRSWRLPPHKAGDYSEAHLANLEASNLDYLMTALMGWLVMIEQEFDLKLLSRREWLAGYYFKHDDAAFLRGDIKTRYESYAQAIRDGWKTRNQVRRAEGLNPMSAEDGGDSYTVQMQVVKLGAEGAVMPKAPAADAPAPPPDDDQADDDQADDDTTQGDPES